MNPEQNKQPNPVDQPPQTELTNQPTTTPLTEPTIIQPLSAAQPVDAAASQPPNQTTTLPIQTPQPVTQQITTTSPTQKSKKPLVFGGIAAVIIIVLASGAIAYSQFGSVRVLDPGHDVKVEDFSFDGTRSDLQSSDAIESENTNENSTESTNTPTSPDSSLDLMQERDTERKYELKNAQQELESYFNDNGEYPADWTVIILDPDGRTGPSGDPYTYVVAADLQTYTLSANLENDSDPKADANGNYVILSVNI